MEELAGSRFDHYIVEDEIGRGGMAIVYRARHVRLDRVCALKILRPELADDERFVERFLREAQRSAQLEHPHIVPIYDTGTANRYYFIAMKYLPGRTLRQEMDLGPIEPPIIADYLTQAASALDYAHGRGIVHRDIKPGNMVIDDQRFLTLTDFGLARASDDMHLTVTGTLMGTPAYMAPEQVQGKVATPPTDVYQLGIVAYEMLAGDTPFGKRAPFALLNAHLNEPPEPLHERAPGLPPELSNVVNKALAKDAGDRYQSAGEFVSALVQYIPGAEAWSRTSAVFVPDETDRLYRGAVAADETTRPRQPVVPGADPLAATPPLIVPDATTSDSERTAAELALGGLVAGAAAGAAGAALHAPIDVTQGATLHEAQSPFANQGATVYETPAPFVGQSATVYEMQAPSGGSTSGQWVAPGAAVAAGATGGVGAPPTYVVPPAEGAPERTPKLYLLLAALVALFLLLGGVGAAFAAGLFDGGGGVVDSTATPTATVAATLTSGPVVASATVTATATEDAGPTASPTPPVRVTTTPRALPTATSTATASPTPSPTATVTPSPTPEPTWTPVPTNTPPPPPTATPPPPPPPPTATSPPPPPPPTATTPPPPPPPTATSPPPPPPPTPTQITVPTAGP